ncbi:hypothetical protein F5Y04DRAFT_287426 [Hypomontagnella monticulosa]|nr:hypothetical protein F5Y04DRAFT_287426 [Hypomontagnella monticulosa]
MTFATIPKLLESDKHFLLRDLWQNKRITDIHSLRLHYHDSAYLALDIEGSDTVECGITAVGIALLRNLIGATRLTETQADLASIVRDYAIEGHNFMCGNHKKNHGQYERSPLAKLHPVQKGDIDKTLHGILESARSTTSSLSSQTGTTADSPNNKEMGSRNFVMVVWAGQSEFLAIASTIPSVIQHVSHWVDLQDLVTSMSATRDTKPFSLRDTMLSLGFGREDIQKLSRSHSAGMDAVRTLGVLIEVYSKTADKLLLSRHTMIEHLRRKMWEVRPSPHENFPFTTRITTAEHLMPPSLRYSQNLLNLIRRSSNAIEPVAVAVCPPTKQKIPKRHAWVCFADQRGMDWFVKEWDGKQIDGQILQVEVILPSI